MALHSSGTVVGCSNTEDTTTHAFRWRNGKMTDIGASKDFPGGTCAYGISPDGNIIVGSGDDASGQSHALRFEGDKVISLDTEVQRHGWTLQKASAVNDAGNIVGVGMLDGEVHGFKLVPTGDR